MATESEIEVMQCRLQTLKKQRDSGVAKVSYAGRTIEYRTFADIDRAIFKLEAEIRDSSIGSRRNRQLKTYSSKAL